MKNFLLVVPRFVNKGEYYNFPVGVAYVSSYLKKQGANVFCLNLCHFEKQIATEDILREYIAKNNIDVFCTGTMSWYWNEIEEILKLAKKIKPDIVNILGGAILISDPELAMRNLAVDIGITGEGELTMAELADVLSKSGDIAEVNGICFLKDDKLITTPPRPFIDDLDSLPFPDYEGFEFEQWCATASQSGMMDILGGQGTTRYAEIIGSRSCPFSCTFCYHHLGQKYRQRSLENIFAEIDFLTKKYNINSVYFLDELFSANHARMKRFAEMIKEHNVNGWGGSFRVNDVNAEILRILKDSGIKLMSYGIENINDAILVSMNKRITKIEIENALKLTKEAGIYGNGNIIFGDPAETEETTKKTLQWLADNPQYNISIVFVKVIPDAPLFQYAVKNNLITDKLKHIKDKFPIINLTKINEKNFYDWVRKITWISYVGKFLLTGRLVDTTKTNTLNGDMARYSFTAECPFCGQVSRYTRHKNDSLFNFLLCDKCKSHYKIKSSKIFLKDYPPINASLFNFKIYFLNYLQKYKFFRDNKSAIINFLSKTKQFFKKNYSSQKI